MATLSPGQARESASTVQPSTGNEHGGSVSTIRWTLATRIGFRFCFAYIILYTLAGKMFTMLSNSLVDVFIPGISRLWPMRQITLWTAAHVLHVIATVHPSGAGDTAFDWVETFCILVTAVVATAVWSLFDRHRMNYVTLHKWFRLSLRFTLAAIMFFYASIKIFPLQMPYPPLPKLVEPYGDFSPMSALWFSIGAAPAYEIFTGCAELIGGVLLILPVTSTLGALFCAADLGMIFMLNMSYDVTVKQLSFHFLLIALFLIAPDFRRLVSFFITNRATQPSMEPRLLRTARANRIALAIQLVFGLYLLTMNLSAAQLRWYRAGGGRTKPALYGIWNVDKMTIDGQFHPPLLTDGQYWRRVLFDTYDDVEIQDMNDNLVYLVSSGKAGELDLRDRGPIPPFGYPGHPGLSGHFAMVRRNSGQLTLDGSMSGHHIHAELTRLDLRQFTLVSRGFHWVNEYPFWR